MRTSESGVIFSQSLPCSVWYISYKYGRGGGGEVQFDREDEDVPILHTRTSNADLGAQKSADDELQKAPYAPPSHRGVRIYA